MHNHCTLWPDAWAGIWYGYCCAAHDVAYGAGLPRLAADNNLARCISAAGLPLMALVVRIGVRLFGYHFWRAPRRD